MKDSDRLVGDRGIELTYRISPSEPPSTAVLEATAEATGSSVDGLTADDDEDVLDPLYEVIDPEVLHNLFQPKPRGEERSAGRILFVYEGCTVELHSRGVVKIQPKQEVGETIDADD